MSAIFSLNSGSSDTLLIGLKTSFVLVVSSFSSSASPITAFFKVDFVSSFDFIPTLLSFVSCSSSDESSPITAFAGFFISCVGGNICLPFCLASSSPPIAIAKHKF